MKTARVKWKDHFHDLKSGSEFTNSAFSEWTLVQFLSALSQPPETTSLQDEILFITRLVNITNKGIEILNK